MAIQYLRNRGLDVVNWCSSMKLTASLESLGARSVNMLALLTILAVGGGVTRTQGEEETTMRDNEKSTLLRYPSRIALPEDIPSVDTVVDKENPKSTSIIIPGAYYLEAHYDGWQMFLKYFQEEGELALSKPWEAPMVSINQRYTHKGMGDGYEYCRAQALKMVAEEGVSNARRHAGEAYRPRLIYKAPPRRD